MTTATWNGATIAESDKTVVVEGNHYFPPGSVRKEFLRRVRRRAAARGRVRRDTTRWWWTERPTRTPRGTTRSRRRRLRISRTTWLSGTALTSASTSERPRHKLRDGCAP